MELKGDKGQLFAIERSVFGEPGASAEADLLLNVTVKVGGYAAADQSWVMADDWRAFLTDLRELERTRRGKATLEGASPRDLKLVLCVIDPIGHMAISGHLGWDSPDGFAQKLEFGFEIDAGMLQTTIREIEELGRK